MNFFDEAKIYLKSGNGGNGCISLHREKFIEYGGPDGGNGGNGGSIIIRSDANINTLSHYRFKHHFKADSGEAGKGKNRTGKSGEHLILYVPVGTQVFDETQNSLIFDFVKPNMEFEILKGGKGGAGNACFKSSTNRTPTFSIKGEQGSEVCIWLKLKLFSEVGVIGLPNAGKSTFLSRVTAARPKIADYPFTTLVPNLGVVHIQDEEFVIADIPGLIEGAHLGHGLGIKFLKHIERCGILLHLIDANSSNIIQDYTTVRNELNEYSNLLRSKKEIICITKCETIDEETLKNQISLLKSTLKCEDIFYISSLSNIKIKELLSKLVFEIEEFRKFNI